jgi:NDP-sugar pyrophosphorylase family protein
MLAARDVVKEPFAVINADDFYGKSAYELLAAHLKNAKAGEYCMVGYVLENTLTENGTVSRGVCQADGDGRLMDVVERTAIRRRGDVAVFEEKGVETELPLNAVVSMNCWGFTPDIFDGVMEGFEVFLSDLGDNPLKCEYYLPFAVRELMAKKACTVQVYESDSAWYGVTYHEDKEKVQASIMALKEAGIYPERLSK